MYGAILGGGTKFECAVGEEDRIEASVRIPTTTPTETIKAAVDFFQNAPAISAIGVGCFGPLDFSNGSIANTPKAGWSQFPLVSELGRALRVPVALDTDVDAEVLGERLYGAGRGLRTLVYLTVGTGIGGGAIVNGELLHGLTHPEMGHILLPHDLSKDPFPGICSHHKDCFEGLASGPAIEARWNRKPGEIPADHPAWELEAHYIALALMSYVHILSPERIILGGGVFQDAERTNLLPRVREKLAAHLGSFIHLPARAGGFDQFVVLPQSKNPGLLGALALAKKGEQLAKAEKPSRPRSK